MPEWEDEVRKRLGAARLDAARKEEIVLELAQHLEDRFDELRAGGRTEESARNAALLELAEPDVLAREVTAVARPMRPERMPPGAPGTTLLADLARDVHHGLRMLRRNPGYATVAVLTLALGIAANTTVFSLVSGLLLRPLPYADSDRVVFVVGWDAREGRPRFAVSAPDFLDWQRQSRSFADLALYRYWSVNLGGQPPERVQGYRVAPNTFALLGIAPLLGQGFPTDAASGQDQVVVLSHGLWQRRFGADPAVVGRTIPLNGTNHLVVGVMPPEFEFPQFNFKGDLWAPLLLTPEDKAPERRGNTSYVAVGRLARGVSPEQAQAELETICAELERRHPETNVGRTARVRLIQEMATESIRPALWALLGAVGFVLLVACSSVANMLLARAAGRAREIALRVTLGASRSRLVRQLLAESLLLAMLGSAAGLMMARVLLELLRANTPDFVASVLPGILRVGIDAPVVWYAVALAVATSLVFGLVPALRASRMDLQSALRVGGPSSTSPRRARSALVAVQCAMAVVLLVGAGLMIRSFRSVLRLEPGFEPSRLLTLDLTLPEPLYPDAPAQAALARTLVERVATLPGVSATAVVSSVPFSTSSEGAAFAIEGGPEPRPGEAPRAAFDRVSPEYFRAMGIPLLRGRVFTPRDHASVQPVAIVSEALIRRYWAGREPLGDRIQLGRRSPENPPRAIVGIAADIRDSGDGEPQGRIAPTIYVPYDQMPRSGFSLVVRTELPSAALLAAVRREVRSLDPDLPVYNLRSMEELLAQARLPLGYAMSLMSWFGAQALLMAGLGIYGLVAYAVGQRRREIGIRIALGAARADVLRLVVSEGLRPAQLGIGLGLGVALGLSRFLAALLAGIEPRDPLTFVAVPFLLAVVAALACYLPARRATRVDPVVALRAD